METNRWELSGTVLSVHRGYNKRGFSALVRIDSEGKKFSLSCWDEAGEAALELQEGTFARFIGSLSMYKSGKNWNVGLNVTKIEQPEPKAKPKKTFTARDGDKWPRRARNRQDIDPDKIESETIADLSVDDLGIPDLGDL